MWFVLLGGSIQRCRQGSGPDFFHCLNLAAVASPALVSIGTSIETRPTIAQITGDRGPIGVANGVAP